MQAELLPEIQLGKGQRHPVGIGLVMGHVGIRMSGEVKMSGEARAGRVLVVVSGLPWVKIPDKNTKLSRRVKMPGVIRC